MSNTLMCWYTETAGIALLVARVVPETDVRESTLGTLAHHMEDNFELDFLRRNFHISSFDFRHISALPFLRALLNKEKDTFLKLENLQYQLNCFSYLFLVPNQRLCPCI